MKTIAKFLHRSDEKLGEGNLEPPLFRGTGRNTVTGGRPPVTQSSLRTLRIKRGTLRDIAVAFERKKFRPRLRGAGTSVKSHLQMSEEVLRLVPLFNRGCSGFRIRF